MKWHILAAAVLPALARFAVPALVGALVAAGLLPVEVLEAVRAHAVGLFAS